MSKSSYLDVCFNDSPLHATEPYRRNVPMEYEGFGGYNRTAMARVSKNVPPYEDDDKIYNSVSELPVSVIYNDSMFVKKKRKKRTWDGVFLPVSISIFGVVLFFRLPWIIGECGLGLTLLAIAISFCVTLLTTCSLAAISTNGYVGDGGLYLMISRCLGPQIGVTVGMALVFANTLASAMYLVGDVGVVIKSFNNSTLLHWLSSETYSVTLIFSSVTLLFLLLVSLLKLDKVFGLACFLLTLTALVNFVICALVRTTPLPSVGYTAAPWKTLQLNWFPDFSKDTNFQKVLFVLFPGVCGLMSGVSSSGELRNGSKAIPKGIMYAWFLSLATYLVTSVVVAASFQRGFLKADYYIMGRVSYWPLFIPGEFCASFALVLAGMVGSSRVLNAIAADDILPHCFFRWIARSRPKVSLLIMYACIQAILFSGNNYTIVSAFATQIFLVTFLALNVSVFLSSAVGLTSFRPAFSFLNTLTAFLGALASLALMFFIEPLTASCVLLFVFVMLVLVDLTIDSSKVYWGDASQPLLFHLVRKFLLRLDERKAHVRHWRPSIIQIVTDPLCSLNLIHLANNLKKGGLYEVCLVLRGDFHSTTKSVFRWKGWLMDFIEASGVKAFPVVMSAKELRPAAQSMLRLCGLGCMRPNTLLLSMDEVLQREYFEMIFKTYNSATTTTRTTNECGKNRTARTEEDGYNHTEEEIQPEKSSFLKKVSAPRACQQKDNVPLIRLSNSSSQFRHSWSKKLPMTFTCASDRRRGFFIDERTYPQSRSFSHVAAPAEGLERSLSESINGEGSMLLLPPEEENVLSPFQLPWDVHTLHNIAILNQEEEEEKEKGEEDVLRGGDGLLDTEKDWSEWLKQSMWGSECLMRALTETDITSLAIGQRRGSISDRKKFQRETETEGMEDTHSSSTHTAPMRSPFCWGLFRSGRADANEDDEQRLVEQMVAHRHNAQLVGETDLAGYRDKTEFCCIARDAANAFMNVVIARNMDLLDTDAIEKKGKERKWFIDIWLPEESDVMLFLMAHCLSLTSVWKKHAMVRVVSVVTMNEDVPERVQSIRKMLKAHRLVACHHVVSLEDMMERCGVLDIALMEQYFEDPMTRPGVINSLVHAEMERTEQRVALVMMRVSPFTRKQKKTSKTFNGDDNDININNEKNNIYDINGAIHGDNEDDNDNDNDDGLGEEAETWFNSLQEMTLDLPPCLLLAGEMLRCRSTDW